VLNLGPVNPAWLLYGDTGRELRCDLARLSSGHWRVSLSLGSERMLSEEFSDLERALKGSERLKAGLITKGWAPSPISTSRAAHGAPIHSPEQG
jgi:hypothetical protein